MRETITAIGVASIGNALLLQRRTVLNSNATRVSGQASPGDEPQPFFQALRGFFSFQNTQ